MTAPAKTITVACRLPNGLVITWPTAADGARTDKTKTVVLRGTNSNPEAILLPNGKGQRYALTHGVDEEWFEAWAKEHPDYAPLTSGMIFTHSKDVVGKAKELAGERHGLDGLDPDKPSPGITKMDKAEA